MEAGRGGSGDIILSQTTRGVRGGLGFERGGGGG